VLHAVGPDFRKPQARADPAYFYLLVTEAYAAALRIAQEEGIVQIAFPLLSAGAYRGQVPLDQVVKLACRAVVENYYDTLDIAWLYAWTPEEHDAVIQCMGTLVREGLVRRCEAEKKSKCHDAFTTPLSGRIITLLPRHRRDALRDSGAALAARLGQHGRVVAEK
jgi:hypothetical protein